MDASYQTHFPGVPEEITEYSYNSVPGAAERSIHFAGQRSDGDGDIVSVNYPQPVGHKQMTPRAYDTKTTVIGGSRGHDSPGFHAIGTDARDIHFPDESDRIQTQGGAERGHFAPTGQVNLLTGVLQTMPILANMATTANAVHSTHSRASAASIGEVAERFQL